MNVSANQSGVFGNNETLEELNEAEFLRLIPTLVYMLIILLVGVSGNGLVCYIYGLFIEIRTSPKWFVFFLACQGIFCCLVMIPSDIWSLTQQFTFTNPVWCKIDTFILLASNIAQGSILFIVALDRFLKIYRPHGWQISYKKARYLSPFAVIASCAISTPIFVVYDIYEFKLPGYDVIASECVYGNNQGDHTYVIVGMVIFCLSIVLMGILYCLIGKVTIQHIKQEKKLSVHDPVNLSEEYEKRAKARKATFMMFLVSLAFVAGYLPPLGLILARSLKSDFSESMTVTQRAVYKFFVRSYYLNYAIYPFIFCSKDSEFRKKSVDVLRRLFGWISSTCNNSERQ